MRRKSKAALRPEPFLVEFVGVQGSGKTTLSRLVCAQLTSQGHSVNTKADLATRGVSRHLSLLMLILYRPRVLIEIIQYLTALRPRRLRRLVRHLRRASDLYVIQRRGGLWVLEEGMVHRMYLDAIGHKEAAARRRELLMLESYRGIAPNALFVMVQADNSTLKQRLQEPGHAHCIFNRVPSANVDDLISTSAVRAENEFALALRVLKAAGIQIAGVGRANVEASRVVEHVLTRGRPPHGSGSQ